MLKKAINERRTLLKENPFLFFSLFFFFCANTLVVDPLLALSTMRHLSAGCQRFVVTRARLCTARAFTNSFIRATNRLSSSNVQAAVAACPGASRISSPRPRIWVRKKLSLLLLVIRKVCLLRLKLCERFYRIVDK